VRRNLLGPPAVLIFVSPLNRYTCEEVFRRIDEFLDRELRPGEVARVRAHLETCAACAGEYAFEESVLISVREKLRRVDVPSELRERIAMRLAEARSSKSTES
jgi:anti-sigma factor (TIGR02949 family)